VAVDDVGDLRMAAVVLVQQQGGLAVLRGGVVRGVEVVGESAVLEPGRAQPRPDTSLAFLLR
jgi:hypothetical protein